MSLSWQILQFEELASTQDAAREHIARTPEISKTAILAKRQTAGRGRAGNGWETCDGNLAMTVICPAGDLAAIGQLSFLAAVALHRTLDEYIDESHTIQNKWPNDLLVDGRKIAGILLEVEKEHLLIGMGVNLAAAPPERIALKEVTGEEIEVLPFAEVLLANLDVLQNEYAQEGFPAIREEWLDHAASLHGRIRARLPSAVFEGIFEGLEADGALRLRLDNGDIKVIHSAEVFLG